MTYLSPWTVWTHQIQNIHHGLVWTIKIMIFWKIDIKSDGGCYKYSFFKWKFKFCYKFSQTPRGFVHNLPVGWELDFQSQPYFFTPSTVSSTKIPTWFDQILIRIGNFSGRVPSSSMVSTDVHKSIAFHQKFIIFHHAWNTGTITTWKSHSQSKLSYSSSSGEDLVAVTRSWPITYRIEIDSDTYFLIITQRNRNIMRVDQSEVLIWDQLMVESIEPIFFLSNRSRETWLTPKLT